MRRIHRPPDLHPRGVQRFKLKLVCLLLAGIFCLGFSLTALAAIPEYINFQGKITDANGNAVPDGTYTVTFRLYAAETGGSALWSEEQTVTTTSGVFNAALGTVTSLDLSFDSEYWLSVQLSGDIEMTPRQRLTAAGYALNADNLDSYTSGQFLRSDADDSASGQITLNYPGTALIVQPSSAPAANSKLVDAKDTDGTSKFSVDYEGDVVVQDMTVSSGLRIGTGGTPSNFTALADDSLFVEGNLEVDGAIYGDGSNLTGISVSANTLDEAYDEGGQGVGREITVDTGAVKLTGSNATDETLEVTNSGNGGALLIENTGSGLSLRVNDAASDTTPFVIDSGGLVGIGTTAPWQELTVSGDMTLSDDHPNITFRDSTAEAGNHAYQWHLETDSASAPYNNFALFRGTDSGSGFSVGVGGVPLMYFDSSNVAHFPAGGIDLDDDNITTTGVGTFSYVNITDESNGYQIDGTRFATNVGTQNVLVGDDAGNNDPGVSSVFIGYQAGYNNDTTGTGSEGETNIYIGDSAGYGETGGTNNTGRANIGIGYQALWRNTSGYTNVAIGEQSLQSNTTGFRNTAVGIMAMAFGSTANYNVALGHYALRDAGDDYNTALGYYTAEDVTGTLNTAIGAFAIENNLSGVNNTAVGAYAGRGVNGQSHSNNSLFGYSAGAGLTIGGNNVLLGYQAGDSITSGTDNIIIGYDEDTPANNTTHHLNIGGTIYGDLQNGLIGIGTSAPWQELTVLGDATLSDDSPNLTFRDSTAEAGNHAYQWHLETDSASAPYNNFALFRGTDSGSGFSVGNGGVPLMYFDNNNDVYITTDLIAKNFNIDTTNKQLETNDGTGKAIPLRHMAQGCWDLASWWDVDHEVWMMDLHSDVYPNGIVITEWHVDSSVAAPDTELNANLYYCDAVGGGAFPGSNPVLVDVLDSTTGNSNETTMASSDLGSGVIPTGKTLYVLMDADPTDANTLWHLRIHFYIPES